MDRERLISEGLKPNVTQLTVRMWPVDFAFSLELGVGCGLLRVGMRLRREHTSVPLTRVLSLEAPSCKT